jgi:hypothetical protein
MLNNVSSPTTSDAFPVENSLFSVQVFGRTTSGAGTAQVKIWGSNSTAAGVPWVPVCTIDLALGTTVAGDGAVVEFSWKFVRAELVSISGTGAVISAIGNNKYVS